MFFETKNLCFSYYKKPLCLKDINIKIKKRQKLICLASNEMGKTSLLKVLSSYENSYFGKILLAGNELKTIEDKEKNFSLILEKPILLKRKTIKENLDYFCEINNLQMLTDEEINQFLKNYKIDRKSNEKIKKLSLFEMKKLSIFRALLKNPTILFLDDQFVDLSDSEADEMKTIYEKLFNCDDLTIVATLGDDSYKKVIRKDINLRYDNVLYLCNAEIKEYKTFSEFEEKRDNFDIVNFLPIYESFLLYLVFEHGEYYLDQDGETRKLDLKFYKSFENLKLNENEMEECLILLKNPTLKKDENLESLIEMLKNSEANLFSCLTGEKLI